MAALAAIVAGVLLRFPAASPDTVFVEDRSFGVFDQATRIVVDFRDRIFVVDRAAHTIFYFPPDSRSQRTIGGFGWETSAFDQPEGIASDGLNLFVADFGNHRVVRFDPSMTPVSSLTTRDTSSAQARFGYPLGTALSRQGDLYVLDGENIRVVKFDGRSRFVRAFGGIEAGAGRLREPVGILVDDNDRVLVLESDRLVEFDFIGNYIRTVGLGTIRSAVGFDATTSSIFVNSKEMIWEFDRGGALLRTLDVAISFLPSPGPIADIKARGDLLYILTPGTIKIFRAGNSR